MSNAVQADQSDIRRFEMTRTFIRGLPTENQRILDEIEQENERLTNFIIVIENLTKRLGLKINPEQ
jgi:hypothetical protein